jgi:hypothetical protein
MEINEELLKELKSMPLEKAIETIIEKFKSYPSALQLAIAALAARLPPEDFEYLLGQLVTMGVKYDPQGFLPMAIKESLPLLKERLLNAIKTAKEELK